MTIRETKTPTILPQFLRIMGVRVPLVIIPPTAGEEDENGYSRATREIGLHYGMAPNKQAQVLLHEVIHQIDDQLEIGLKEKQVQRLATGILAFLLDNPTVIGYIRNGIEDQGQCGSGLIPYDPDEGGPHHA